MIRNYRPAPLSHGERARWRRLQALLVELDEYPWRDLAGRRDQDRGRPSERL